MTIQQDLIFLSVSATTNAFNQCISRLNPSYWERNVSLNNNLV